MVISPSEYIKKCLKIDFDNSVENIIDTGASIIIFEKGTMPIEMGEMINCFYFIIYGLVRGYYIDDDGNEVTKCFVYENGFFGSECYRTKDTSTFFVDCLEECKCIKLPYFLIQKNMSIDQRVNQLIHSMYLNEIGKLEDRTRKLLLLTAEERYIFFCREYPNLQRRLQLKYIASYIGIKAASMSRIRKKLKNQI